MESGMTPSAFPRTSRAKGRPSCSVYFSSLGARVRALLASFQTLTTTQTTILERMDHFQLQQDQQTLILREIQQHLGLLPPTPPVASPLLSGDIASSLLLSLVFGTLGQCSS
ncbi:hypothetical protein CK203_056459 [Vitis vinifera]|uniref:Uncharacterized protein n=1 Tax=Vitis vinifera TaxID=29760 RepID=A0A438GTM5_VITVI|nr:hypothetical protein CK203_056459 [Vitis vinifera]